MCIALSQSGWTLQSDIITSPKEIDINIFENGGSLTEGEINPEYCNKILQD